MLERAAGCLENAGRRFFRDSKGALRGRRSWYPHFTQSNGTTAEAVPLSHSPSKTSGHHDSISSVSWKASQATADTWTPVLDFLYPPRTQEFVASLLLRPPRRLALRRKKKLIPALTRAYTNVAASLYKPGDPDKPEVDLDAKRAKEFERREAKQELQSILNESKPGIYGHYDRAWELYETARRPKDLSAALLAHLSRSSVLRNNLRAQWVYRRIPFRERSAEDSLSLAKSYLSIGKPDEINRVCRDAKGTGGDVPCWALAFSHFVNNGKWDSAEKFWNARPPSSEKALLSAVASELDDSSLPMKLFDLAKVLRSQETSRSWTGLVHFLLDYAFSNPRVAADVSTENLLLLLKEYNLLGFLTAEHYFRLIRTLQSSDVRSTFTKSIVVYRNLRWQMEQEVPPADLLGAFLRSLAHFEITTGIHYFLGEYAHFYGQPSIDAYKSALTAFSRAGDMENTNSLFEQLVMHHGKPLSRRLLTPLLYVHARVGDVTATRRQFERVSKEFGLKQNTVCWNILLTAYANADDFGGAFATFDKMLEEGVQPNSHTFGALMGLCANRGDIDTVRQLLELAKRSPVRITTPLLDTIVEAYCNNRELEKAESVAETCLGLDVKGSRVRMWNVLLWNYAFRMDLESISRIRSRMDSAGVQPDSMTYAALMLSLVLRGQTDPARRILRTLHRSNHMYATEFHYAIILYGYVKERNRDMVHIIFREIKERFKRPGFTSRLLVLRNQLQRDLELIKTGGRAVSGANVRLENAERFLVETIADFDKTNMASKEPLPGAGRLPITQAFPAMYYEYLITAYGTRGVFHRVKELFDQFLRNRKSPTYERPAYDVAPLRLVSALMLTYLKSEQYKKVEECWRITFPRVVKMATQPDLDEWLSDRLLRAEETGQPDYPIPSPVNSHKNVLLSSDKPDLLALKPPSILPACRFLLSRPLSLYMRSLAYRNETWKIPQVVAEVQKAGFPLTTFNWSTYVQMLASSDKPSDQVEAFTVFERKFMPNFPGWNNLRRGYGVRPPGVPSTIDVMENPRRAKPPNMLGKESRRYWSKIQPDFMQPTYVSMVYLASALQAFRERSIFDGGLEVGTLYKVAPKTITALADMPYLREKFQGVLLRRRQEQGDKKGDSRDRDHFVWTGGILGVGGKPRSPTAVEQSATEANQEENASANARSQPVVIHQEARDGTNAPAVKTESLPEDVSTPDTKSIDPQDQFDIEAEALLGSRRALIEASEALLDNENRVSVDECDETDMSALMDDLAYPDEDAPEAADGREQEELPAGHQGQPEQELHNRGMTQDA
ncbi:pentatricopeptide repeat-containing protein At1g05670, mitochondrial [Aspergillus udagawae]|nr:pentatricopeptide repeat-containing protein At1g05670, mitochondrial [Aspergillus udagawae]